MKITPLGDRILVKPDDEAAEQQGGIYLPDSAKEKPQQGTAVSVGPDVENVKKGDRVLLPRYGGTEVSVKGADHSIFREEDILGILK